MTQIPLEDSFLDIVRKALSYAQIAAKIGDQSLAAQSGIPIEVWRDLKNGIWNDTYGPRAAQFLGLNPRALAEVAHQSWHPQPISLPFLYQSVTPFSPTSVNAYLLWNPQSKEAIIIDTGIDSTPILNFITKHQLQPKIILLTHSDIDHIFELDRLIETTSAPAFIHHLEHIPGTIPIDESSDLSLGNWKINVLHTPGHTPGSVTYLLPHTSPPIAFTGDAIMAATIGKVRSDFNTARNILQQKILSLPPQTVLAPGHGPLTTVENEKRHNPFLAL